MNFNFLYVHINCQIVLPKYVSIFTPPKNMSACFSIPSQTPDIVEVFVFSKRIFQSLISTYLSIFYICIVICLFFLWITRFLSFPLRYSGFVCVFWGFSGKENATLFTYLSDTYPSSEILPAGQNLLIQQVKLIQWILWLIFRSALWFRKIHLLSDVWQKTYPSLLFFHLSCSWYFVIYRFLKIFYNQKCLSFTTSGFT